jgi:geranylgeranyl transferase type-2 subunit alpha
MSGHGSTFVNKASYYSIPDCAWFHRLWIVQRLVIDFDGEFELCAEFLRQDQRNFHCWNYRRALHKISGRTGDQEFQFSTDKIAENFSNYSAFHHRSKYIDSALTTSEVCDFVESEMKIIESAIFTEPDDQSAWWYHQYLLNWIKKQDVAYTKGTWLVSTVMGQFQIIDDLLSIEENCRWAMNCIIFMIDFLVNDSNLRSYLDEETSKNFATRRLDLLNKLLEIDPNHENRYRYLMNA